MQNDTEANLKKHPMVNTGTISVTWQIIIVIDYYLYNKLKSMCYININKYLNK